jgi:hypothetical protein
MDFTLMNFYFNVFVVNVRRVSRLAEVHAHKRRPIGMSTAAIWLLLNGLRIGTLQRPRGAALKEPASCAFLLG